MSLEDRFDRCLLPCGFDDTVEAFIAVAETVGVVVVAGVVCATVVVVFGTGTVGVCGVVVV